MGLQEKPAGRTGQGRYSKLPVEKYSQTGSISEAGCYRDQVCGNVRGYNKEQAHAGLLFAVYGGITAYADWLICSGREAPG